jgi:histidinol-phosphate aminotransferase
MSKDEYSSEFKDDLFAAAEALLCKEGSLLNNAERRHMRATLDEIVRFRALGDHELSYRGHLELMKPYVAGRSIASVQAEYGLSDVIKLASNEHAVGPSGRVLDVIRDLLDETHRYPEVRPEDLLEALGAHHGVAVDQLFLGCGSNELLDTVVRVLRPLGAVAVFSAASFSMYRHVMHVYGVPCVEVPVRPGGQDLDALAHAVVENDASFVFLNTPHNPTGQVLTEKEIRGFMEGIGSKPYVLLDEAYAEFAEGLPGVIKGADLLSDYPNLIVCRTFSKAYGLAGLRVGYGIARKEIIELLNRVRQPFNLTRYSAPAALAALQDQEWLKETVEQNRSELQRLRTYFDEAGVWTNPSGANFLLVDLGRPATPLCEAILKKGIVLRALTGYGLPNAFRMTIGAPDENDAFIRVFNSEWSRDS